MVVHRPTLVLIPLLIVVGALAVLWTGAASSAVAAPHRAALEDPPPAAIILTKTVGTGLGCAATTVVTVTAGTVVRYCFSVYNTGSVTFETHVLDDSHLGSPLYAAQTELPPNATITAVYTMPVTLSVTNAATWTAATLDAQPIVVSDTASARVVVDRFHPCYPPSS